VGCNFMIAAMRSGVVRASDRLQPELTVCPACPARPIASLLELGLYRDELFGANRAGFETIKDDSQIPDSFPSPAIRR
jgi:hypothetical protein